MTNPLSLTHDQLKQMPSLTTLRPAMKTGMGCLVTNLQSSLCAYFSSVFLPLLLHLLQRRVANPPSRHAWPSVSSFANSALCLWRRSLMKSTCTHSHAQPLIHTIFYHSTRATRASYFSRFCMLLLVTLHNFNARLSLRALIDMIFCDCYATAALYSVKLKIYIRTGSYLKRSLCGMAVPYPCKRSLLDQFCGAVFPARALSAAC